MKPEKANFIVKVTGLSPVTLFPRVTIPALALPKFTLVRYNEHTVDMVARRAHTVKQVRDWEEEQSREAAYRIANGFNATGADMDEWVAKNVTTVTPKNLLVPKCLAEPVGRLCAAGASEARAGDRSRAVYELENRLRDHLGGVNGTAWMHTVRSVLAPGVHAKLIDLFEIACPGNPASLFTLPAFICINEFLASDAPGDMCLATWLAQGDNADKVGNIFHNLDITIYPHTRRVANMFTLPGRMCTREKLVCQGVRRVISEACRDTLELATRCTFPLPGIPSVCDHNKEQTGIVSRFLGNVDTARIYGINPTGDTLARIVSVDTGKKADPNGTWDELDLYAGMGECPDPEGSGRALASMAATLHNCVARSMIEVVTGHEVAVRDALVFFYAVRHPASVGAMSGCRVLLLIMYALQTRGVPASTLAASLWELVTSFSGCEVTPSDWKMILDYQVKVHDHLVPLNVVVSRDGSFPKNIEHNNPLVDFISEQRRGAGR